ncbi:MAG: tRNA-specific adenosine deaminase [Nitrospira bacterium HGW-Nitrospira-1]|nr:MAG: tRNA-specific adenosine deaminase [Nitrospira bacterium HGW-Nitrospira-1]
MRLALKEAGLAFLKGEVPVGAIVVKDGKVISSSHNLREISKDPSAHAEILAIRTAAKKSDSWRLSGLTLYVTKEPCIMCAGALVNSRIARLVYGCRDEKAGGVDSLYRILNDKRLNHQVEVVSGVLEDECAAILRNFFKERRI